MNAHPNRAARRRAARRTRRRAGAGAAVAATATALTLLAQTAGTALAVPADDAAPSGESAITSPAAQPTPKASPEAVAAAKSIPADQVAAVATSAGVTEDVVRGWATGLAAQSLDTQTGTVVSRPLVAAPSHGLAVSDPFGGGKATSLALTGGSYAATAATKGQDAYALSLLGVSTATAGGAGDAVQCAGVLSVARSSTAGDCVSVGTLNFHHDKRTGVSSLALTDLSRALSQAPGSAGRLALDAISAERTTAGSDLIPDIVRVSLTPTGPELTSDTGAFGLDPADPAPVTERTATEEGRDAVLTPVPQQAPNPVAEAVDQAVANADEALWNAVDPIAPDLHAQVTEVTGKWQADAQSAAESLLPAPLRPAKPKSSAPLAGTPSGEDPAPRTARNAPAAPAPERPDTQDTEDGEDGTDGGFCPAGEKPTNTEAQGKEQCETPQERTAREDADKERQDQEAQARQNEATRQGRASECNSRDQGVFVFNPSGGEDGLGSCDVRQGEQRPEAPKDPDADADTTTGRTGPSSGDDGGQGGVRTEPGSNGGTPQGRQPDVTTGF